MKLLVTKRKRQGRSRKGEGSLRLKNGMYYYRIADPERPGKQVERACHTGHYETALQEKNDAIRRAKGVAEPVALNGGATPSVGATVAEIGVDYLAFSRQKAIYRSNGDPDYDVEKGINSQKLAIKKLTKYLGHVIANDLTTADTARYRKQREEVDGVLFSTVNRELSYLRAAFKKAIQTSKKVSHLPYIWFPSEENQVREGFIERADYEKIFPHLADNLKAIFVCAFHTGARSGELKKIRWSMVNFEKLRIELRAKTTKTKIGRWLPIWGDMLEVLKWQKQIHDRECPSSPWLFFKHMTGNYSCPKYVPGSRLGNMHGTWVRGVKAAGYPSLLFHDLRRSAIKYADQEAKQSPDLVRMMSGHKTQSVYIRYNIRGVSQMDALGGGLNAHLAETGRKQLHLIDPKAA